MITFTDVTKSYLPNVYALRDVNLRVTPGEFVSIVGRSGTGKTTLIKLLIAEEPISAGSLVVGGWDITHIKRYEIPTLRRQIGVVFQDFKLLAKKTVAENISFPMEVVGIPRKKIFQVVSQLLRIVGLESKAHRFPMQLSGGEMQRVAIARALAHRPKLIVADEPTGNLDSINAREIIDLLKKINALGTTVLLVTHNKDIVNSLRRRVITLENGYIISDKSEGKYLL